MKSDEADFEGTRRHYDWENTSTTIAILESIATHESGDPDQRDDVLNVPLHDSVETDALAALVRNRPAATVIFNVEEYRVRIDGEGVYVTDADTACDGAVVK